MYAASPISSASLHSISTQIKVSGSLESQVHDAPIYFHKFSDASHVKLVERNGVVFGLTKQNELVRSSNEQVEKKVELGFSASDICLMNDDLILSQWFDCTLHFYSQEDLRKKSEMSFDLDYQLSERGKNGMTIKAVCFSDGMIFASLNDGGVVMVEGERVSTSRVEKAIFRFIV